MPSEQAKRVVVLVVSACAAALLATRRVPARGRFDPKMSRVCEKSCAAKVPYREADLASQPGAAVGRLTRCPVSGVVFRVAVEGPRQALDGREYQFCCDSCSRLFAKEPRRFARSGWRFL